MTRSEKEALSESQLEMGKRCEVMLESRAWQQANVTYDGVSQGREGMGSWTTFTANHR